MKSLFEKFTFFLKRKFDYHKHNSIENIFTQIYLKNIWGGAKGEFCSGAGSTDEKIVSPYISMFSKQAHSEGFLGLTFVDLGCGDFHVGRQLLPLCSRYIGVDIVQPLVEQNQEKYGNLTTHFIHLNIVDDELPAGDVCIVRQVLQHLSNTHIFTVLKKLQKYRWVYITEHCPVENSSITPNIDKAPGPDIRMNRNSGIYLSRHPFNLPIEKLSDVSEIPYINGGVIRTSLYMPQGK